MMVPTGQKKRIGQVNGEPPRNLRALPPSAADANEEALLFPFKRNYYFSLSFKAYEIRIQHSLLFFFATL